MPEAAFPNVTTGTAFAPFTHFAEILDRSGTVLAACQAAAWKLSGRAGDAGQIESYKGIVGALRGEDSSVIEPHLVNKQNRVLQLEGGAEYRIVDALYNDVLGYFDLTLRQVKPNG